MAASEVPVFAIPAEERGHCKRRLVAVCRAFAARGLDCGFAGHLAVRPSAAAALLDPGHDGAPGRSAICQLDSIKVCSRGADRLSL